MASNADQLKVFGTMSILSSIFGTRRHKFASSQDCTAAFWRCLSLWALLLPELYFPFMQAFNGFLAKAGGKDKLTALIQVRRYVAG